MLAMEDTESTTRQRTTGRDEKKTDDTLVSGKPLHRFLQKEPRCFGIVILMFGVAEMLMGFLLAGENILSSHRIYIPFWQGTLFLLCGILSIYTELHPSKRMVTVCLAMYVVSMLGIVVSACYRIHIFIINFFHRSVIQAFCLEIIMFVFSLCVLILLIFLSTVARLALKSTHTQVIIQHIPLPQSQLTSN